MHLQFFTEIENFRNISSKSFIVQNTFKKLYSYCEQKKDYISIDSIFDYLKTLIYEIPMIRTGYFENYFERFKYEVLFDIYSSITTSEQTSFNKLKMKDCIDIYCVSVGYDLEYTSAAQLISQRKKQMKDDLLTLNPQRSNSKKFSTFYNYICSPLVSNTKSSLPLLPPKDIVFNTKFYNHFIFCKNNINGIQICNYYDLIQEHLEYNKTDELNFDSEYSSYLFEYFHYPIQLVKCFRTYLSQEFCKKTIPDNYWSLYAYTKLFDTHYISLSDYILEKYADDLNYIHDNDSKIKPAFFEMQILESFWLPIINMMIKELLFDLYDGNLTFIAGKCQLSINDLMKSNSSYNYSFYNMLNESVSSLESSKYPSSKKVIEKKAPKTDSLDYLFNCSLTHCFYNRDFPSYLYTCVIPNSCVCSLDLCYQYIESEYTQLKNYLTPITFKNSHEYVKRKLM